MKQYYILALGLAFLSDTCFAGRPSAGSSEGAGKGTAASPLSAPNTQNNTAQPDTTAAPANPQNTATSSVSSPDNNNMIALSVGEAAAIGTGLAFSATVITEDVLSRIHRKRQESLKKVNEKLLEKKQKLSAENDKIITRTREWTSKLEYLREKFSERLAFIRRDIASSEIYAELIQEQLQERRQNLETEKVITQTLKKELTDLEQLLKFVGGADASFGGLKDNLIKALETKVSKLGDKKSESKEEVVTSSGMETVSSSTTSEPPTNPQSETRNNVTKKVEEKSTSKDHLEGLLNELRGSNSQTLQQLHDWSKLHVSGYKKSIGRSVERALEIIDKVHANHPQHGVK